ncbi:MAG: 2-oxoacid:acceptor oxidoreductase subunit alpha [Acidimicrobiales bacterium]
MSDTVQNQPVESIDRVIIRFAGDSGDGMQLTGDRFTSASAMFGNDLATLPDFPAEIRAPAGTIAGVSAFQVHISDHEITTPGDEPNVLVAMNPAALRSDLHRLESGGSVIVNTDAFSERNVTKAGYDTDPLHDGTLDGYKVYEIPMTDLTKKAVEHVGVKPRDAERSKNFFALGLVSWMYTRPAEPTIEWIQTKFAKDQKVVDANTAAFKAGHAFGETAELFDHAYQVKPALHDPGTYTNITGNVALAWGLVAASQLADMPLFLGSYPITPASDILHELSKHKNFGVRTMQAEDEIAGVGAALGAAFGGHLAITTTSGPGLALKGETIGLAVSLELPLVVVDIQRGGPSTGLPTKTEASDLLMALYGRHGESPMPIVAASTPAGCFEDAIEACRIALKYRTPVFLLSDGYLANGAEPWKLPDVDDLPDISTRFETEPNGTNPSGDPVHHPYVRDPDTMARTWALPGTPGLEHRVGGLEKADETGNVSYDPANHERMTHLRQAKIDAIQRDIPPAVLEGDADADLVVIGWGSTWGAISGGVDRIRKRGLQVARIHLRHLNPLPPNLGELLAGFERFLVPEMNLGQLSKVLRAEFLVDAKTVSKVRGMPFTAGEIEAAILDAMPDNEMEESR